MNKLLAIVGMVFVMVSLSGCAKSATENTSHYDLPDGLKDCKIFYLGSDNSLTGITVVRCPNSSTTTTYKQGKTQRSVSVVEGEVEINGEKYQKIPQ
jgi:hypothetical protein